MRFGSQRKRFTAGQMELEQILDKLGIETILEKKIGRYTVDIFCPELNLAIEYDSDYHWKKRDAKRDAELKEMFGLTVLRFRGKLSSELVQERLDDIV